METQPTQQGMMQLFMNLGLATDNPLNTLGSGAPSNDATNPLGFSSILAEYQPDSPLSLLPKTPQGEATSLVDGLQSFLSSDPSVESLPVGTLPPLGEELPLVNTGLPLSSLLSTNFLEVAPLIRDKGLSKEGAEKSLPLNDDPASVAASQGYHAQSLVTSLLPVKASPIVQPQDLSTPASSLAANMNTNLNFRTVSNSLANPTSTALDSELDGEAGAEFKSELNDRFLGAEGPTKKTMMSPKQELSSNTSLQTGSNTIPAPVVDTALLAAINAGEDPATESLQDINHIDDIEKAEGEAKLLSSERKQDDQTLKLTKGQQAWGDALSERISMNAAKDIKQVTIHLDPPELGSLELKLQIKDDQQTQVQVVVQNPQVKEALESSAQRLRDMLADQGLELSEFDVQTGAEQGSGQDGQDEEGLAGSKQQDSDALLAEGEEVSIDISVPKNNNLLDTFV